jgi:hypothetical protein
MMKKNKMRLTLRVMAQSSLIWRLKASFNFFCNEDDNIRAMMDELMVSRCTLPLLLQTIYFHDEKCRYSFFKLFYQIVELSTKQCKKNSPTTKQMRYKFKLEQSKNNVFKKS